MEEIIIQEQITITQKEVNNIIEEYKKYPDTFRLGMLGVVLDKNGIIKEIMELTDMGKRILLIHYEYDKYTKSLSTFPKAKKIKDITDVQKIMDFNSEVWKTKREKNISLRESIENIRIPKALKAYEQDLKACHNLK